MRLKEAYGLHPMQVLAIMHLYEAKGRWVASERLHEVVGFATYDAMKVTVCKARKALGSGSIPWLWGQGYRLGDGIRLELDMLLTATK